MSAINRNITRIFRSGDRRRLYEQLQWQRFLLRRGIPATAQVLDMIEEKERLYGYVQIRFWAMLKLKGNISYGHIQTFVTRNNLPAIGDTIHIRFCPYDMSKVIIV